MNSVAAGDGYLPEADDEKLRTGRFVPDDLLVRSGHGFRIVGRISDIINVAGKKVSPAEVEAVLLQFGGIREAVVFGRQSTLRNEEVAACVVAETEINESELLDFCRARFERLADSEAHPFSLRNTADRARQNQPARRGRALRFRCQRKSGLKRDAHLSHDARIKGKRKETMRTIFVSALAAIFILAAFSGCSTTVRTDNGHSVTTGVHTH